MLIERTENEVIIRIPSYVDTSDLQKLIDFISYKEVTAKTKAKQSDIYKLASIVKFFFYFNFKNKFAPLGL
jgi:hypothetical protein